MDDNDRKAAQDMIRTDHRTPCLQCGSDEHVSAKCEANTRDLPALLAELREQSSPMDALCGVKVELIAVVEASNEAMTTLADGVYSDQHAHARRRFNAALDALTVRLREVMHG